jgi:hypothetical protein
MSNNITAIVLDVKSTYEGEHMIFGLLNLEPSNFDHVEVLVSNLATSKGNWNMRVLTSSMD